jgi:hypothetical protein
VLINAVCRFAVGAHAGTVPQTCPAGGAHSRQRLVQTRQCGWHSHPLKTSRRAPFGGTGSGGTFEASLAPLGAASCQVQAGRVAGECEMVWRVGSFRKFNELLWMLKTYVLTPYARLPTTHNKRKVERHCQNLAGTSFFSRRFQT